MLSNEKLTGPTSPLASQGQDQALVRTVRIAYIVYRIACLMNQDACGVRSTLYDFMYRYALLEV